jgi:hypothetical protein
VPLLKEALNLPYPTAVKPFVALTPDEKQKKVERRWAMRLLITSRAARNTPVCGRDRRASSARGSRSAPFPRSRGGLFGRLDLSHQRSVRGSTVFPGTRFPRRSCRDPASARLLRNKRALPLCLACHDALTTGGLDPETETLQFHGSTPPGCASFLKKPPHLLAKVKRDVRHAVGDAFALVDALAATKVGRRAMFFEVGLTPWAANHLFMEPTGDGKNWRKVARLVAWSARAYREACGDDALLDRAPLFFVDLSCGVRRALDCVAAGAGDRSTSLQHVLDDRVSRS